MNVIFNLLIVVLIWVAAFLVLRFVIGKGRSANPDDLRSRHYTLSLADDQDDMHLLRQALDHPFGSKEQDAVMDRFKEQSSRHEDKAARRRTEIVYAEGFIDDAEMNDLLAGKNPYKVRKA